MKQLSALVLVFAGSAACAQTPTTNPMPDGSRDMYAGLGVVSRPRYEGADSRTVSALPLLQVQWSNGLFISGMNAGMHLSNAPNVEVGPLLGVHPRRGETGTGTSIGGVGAMLGPSISDANGRSRLTGVADVHTRLEGGMFANLYLAPEWRLTSTLLAGAGNERDGVRMELGVQRLAIALAPHHTLSFNAGVTFANRAYQRAYYGVSPNDARTSGHPVFLPGGGIKDLHMGARWNWSLTPSWMLTSQVQAVRLRDSLHPSPLVERPINVTASAALALRF